MPSFTAVPLKSYRSFHSQSTGRSDHISSRPIEQSTPSMAQDQGQHRLRRAMKVGASSAALGLGWGLAEPNGIKKLPVHQWLMASTACFFVSFLIEHHTKRPLEANKPSLQTHVITSICLLGAASLGLIAGQNVGNTLGSLAGLLPF